MRKIDCCLLSHKNINIFLFATAYVIALYDWPIYLLFKFYYFFFYLSIAFCYIIVQELSIIVWHLLFIRL